MVFLSQKLNGIMIFTDYRKVLAFIFSGMGNTVFFLSQRVDGNINIYWLLKSSCFELFGDGKSGLFLSQEVDGKTKFTGYWEVLILNLPVMGNTAFFQPKSWWKDDYYFFFFEVSMIF